MDYLATINRHRAAMAAYSAAFTSGSLRSATTRALLDEAVLRSLAVEGMAPSAVLRNRFEYDGWRRLTTTQVRAACRRLEAKGYVEDTQRYHSAQWIITPAGQSHLVHRNLLKEGVE